MSNLITQVRSLLIKSRTPLKEWQRFRGKINIQRPRAPHYERAKVLAVTEPIYEKPPKSLTCFELRYNKEAEVPYPYHTIIAREVRNWLEHSRMVGIFHLNSIKADDFLDARIKFHKKNMQLKDYPKKIVKMAVEGSRFEAIVDLFDVTHCIVFSPGTPVVDLLSIARKIPQMVLMAGIVDGRLLSRNEMIAYAKLPDLQTMRASVVQTLNMAAGNTVMLLQAHQVEMVRLLAVHANALRETQNREETKSESNDNKTEEIIKTE